MKLRGAIAGVTHKEFKKVWDGHEEANRRMLDCDMRVKIRDVDKRLETCKKNQEENRTKYLQELAVARGAEGKEDIEKAIIEIDRREWVSREAAKIKEAKKGRRSTSLPEVQVPRGVTDVNKMWDKIKGDNNVPEYWETVRGREAVESIISPWCKKHFNQSEGTPFTKG